jgi:hypothetical protein
VECAEKCSDTKLNNNPRTQVQVAKYKGKDAQRKEQDAGSG